MEQAILTKKITYQEYLQLERGTDIRHEFFNGEVFAMAGSSRLHNSIGINIANLLRDNFSPKGCETYISDVKLELQADNFYVYPDVLLTCDKEDNDTYLVKKPSLIVEVLSKSTETYDRSTKLAHYRKIKSLRYYLLVSQTQPMVEVYSRQSDTSLFTYEAYESLEDTVQLPAIDFAVLMTDIYKYIIFTEE